MSDPTVSREDTEKNLPAAEDVLRTGDSQLKTFTSAEDPK